MVWPNDKSYDIRVPARSRYKGLPLFGLRVAGPAMNRRYPAGSVLVCVHFHDLGEVPRHGQRVIVQRPTGTGRIETLVRELRVDGRGGNWLYPDSDHPAHQEPSPAPEGGPARIAALVIGSYIEE